MTDMLGVVERQAMLRAFEGEYGMTTQEFLARWHGGEFIEDDGGFDLLPFEEWARLAEDGTS